MMNLYKSPQKGIDSFASDIVNRVNRKRNVTFKDVKKNLATKLK